MPLVTLTARRPKSPAFKSIALDAVHAALVATGVPPADKFQRFIELDADDFRFDPNYPDLHSSRTDDFMLLRNATDELHSSARRSRFTRIRWSSTACAKWYVGSRSAWSELFRMTTSL